MLVMAWNPIPPRPRRVPEGTHRTGRPLSRSYYRKRDVKAHPNGRLSLSLSLLRNIVDVQLAVVVVPVENIKYKR